MSDPDQDQDHDQRAEAAVAADLLAHGAVVHHLSMALTTVGVVALPLVAMARPNVVAMALATLAVVAGIAELWFGLRVAFDARIFRRLAWAGAAGGLSVAAFDAAMAAVGLMPAGKAGRPLADRVRGAMRLLGRQVGLLILQAVLLVAAGWILAGAKG